MSLLFLQRINDLPQALNKTGSYLYADDTCIFCQDEDVKKIQKVGKNFHYSEWFIDNKLPIRFGDDKTKTFFFCKEKPTKTEHIIQRLLSKTAQYCRIFWVLP